MSAPVTNGGSRRAKSGVGKSKFPFLEKASPPPPPPHLHRSGSFSILWKACFRHCLFLYLQNGNFILLHFSSMVAILGCESHRQAGSTFLIISRFYRLTHIIIWYSLWEYVYCIFSLNNAAHICCNLFGNVGSFHHRDDIAFLLKSFSIKTNYCTELPYTEALSYYV